MTALTAEMIVGDSYPPSLRHVGLMIGRNDAALLSAKKSPAE
jgi:hypothetical protein